MNVLICCGAGMSSGFIAQQMRKAIKKRGLLIKVEARSESETSLYLKDISVLCIGPHYADKLGKFEQMAQPYGVPVILIPQKIYGSLDGSGLLDMILQKMENQIT